MKPKRLFRCPECGDTLKEEDYDRQFDYVGMGMCYCKFSEVGENGDVLFPRILVEYDVYHLSAPTMNEVEK